MNHDDARQVTDLENPNQSHCMGGKIRQVGSAKTLESASPDMTPMSSGESTVPELQITLRIEFATKDREFMDAISNPPFYLLSIS